MSKRIFKFRAWNSSEKRMHDSEDMMLSLSFPSFLAMNNSERSSDVLMQWTGFTDKNGVDIYEGDIIGDSFYEANMLVYWKSDYGKWMYAGKSSDDGCQYDDSLANQCREDIEVIGNIYENPELTEDNNEQH